MNFKNFKLNSFKPLNILCMKTSRVWFLLIFFFTFVNIVILGYSAYVYFKIDLGSAFTSDVSVSVNRGFERIRKNDLLKVINYFDNKQSEFDQLIKKGPPKIVDPSL